MVTTRSGARAEPKKRGRAKNATGTKIKQTPRSKSRGTRARSNSRNKIETKRSQSRNPRDESKRRDEPHRDNAGTGWWKWILLIALPCVVAALFLGNPSARDPNEILQDVSTALSEFSGHDATAKVEKAVISGFMDIGCESGCEPTSILLLGKRSREKQRFLNALLPAGFRWCKEEIDELDLGLKDWMQGHVDASPHICAFVLRQAEARKNKVSQLETVLDFRFKRKAFIIIESENRKNWRDALIGRINSIASF